MNQIAGKQNDEAQLHSLAAQRELYRRAKRFVSWQAVLAMPVAIGWAVLARFIPAVEPWSIAYAVVAIVLELVVFDSLKKSWIDTAAFIQEEFDCEVLELPWNATAAEHVAREVIAEASAAYRAKRVAPLRDWYRPEVASLPLERARVVCQRQSAWWEHDLRWRYALGINLAVFIVVIAVVAVAVAGDASTGALLVAVGTVLPALAWGVREARAHKEAGERARRLRGFADALLDELASGNVSTADAAKRSRELQDEILHHRRNSPLVFDWAYERLRERQETQSRAAAEQAGRDAAAHR